MYASFSLKEIETQTRAARNAILNAKQLWDNPVPYVLDSNLDMNAKRVILQAFEHFHLKSCIDFKPRQTEKLEHELLHVLGLYHKQSRYDRDDYITMWKNIKDGFKEIFQKSTPTSSTFNAPYDYLSLMHYGKNFFSKNMENTIVTKLPQYQDKIGQWMEMSPTDIYKLNHLYNCNKSVSFMELCDFSSVDICRMRFCNQGLTKGWRRMSAADGGPHTDHTNLNKTGGGVTSCMRAQLQVLQGDSAWLETKKLSPTRECHVQCLQFYFYHSGSPLDQLNIWIREYFSLNQSYPTYEWQFHNAPLNATNPFQAVFEVRNGYQDSSGGLSMDDIDLPEAECPHNVWQIKDFERLLTTTDYNSYLLSPQVYSREGFAYQMLIALRETFFGVSFRLVSGDYDSSCCHQQSMQRYVFCFSAVAFDNPHIVGRQIIRNKESLYVNPAKGVKLFLSLEQI
uniref:Metalloendopeptidase n=1 Tax=Amphiprion ocellaris TaxID=80972 RepID=A0A3Q1AT82_AMPOC